MADTKLSELNVITDPARDDELYIVKDGESKRVSVGNVADQGSDDGDGGGVTEDRVQELIDATSLSALQGQVTDSQIPDAIMRDSELTASAVRTLLGLTADEVTNLLVGQPISGQVLTFTLNDGTSHSITIPAAAGDATVDGVVTAGAFNDDGTEIALTVTTDGTDSTVTINVPELLRVADRFISPNADGTLPDAADHQGKFVVSGNFLFESIDHGGHDKVVAFLPYGPNRTTPPARSTNENNYGGSFEFPPHDDIGDYDVDTVLWDRGSEVWLIKSSASATRWSSYSGPLYWHHGDIYTNRDVATNHVSHADDVGARIVIYGYGSTQKPYMVTAYTAGTDDDWQWDPIGVTLQDVEDTVNRHRPSDKPKQVISIPSTYDEEVLYLTHDEITQGSTASDKTITIGESAGEYGYSDGSALPQAYGSDSGSSPLAYFSGSGVGPNSGITSFTPEFVGSHNRDFMENIRTVEINGTDYLVSAMSYTYGAFHRTVIAPPTVTDATFTYNFKDEDDNFYFTTETDVDNEAGIWQWNGTEYERLAAASEAIAALRDGVSSALDTLAKVANALGDKVEISAYSSTATYSRGSANSIVTHSSGLFIYISSTERSSGHDPDTQPGYWLKLSEGVAYEVITSGSHRIAARTLVVNGDNDNVYLCTTTQTTPVSLTEIHTASESAGGAFILLNGGGSGGFTLRQGTTAPGNSLGDDGDWYLRTSNGQWYEKVSGTWESRYTDQVGQAGSGITQIQADARYAQQSENLSDLDSAETARTNLGLGDAAEQDVGHGEGNVPQLDANGDLNVSTIPGSIARLAGPALTGTPTAPTAADGTNTTQIATTAFVEGVRGIKVVETALPAPSAVADDDRVKLHVVKDSNDLVSEVAHLAHVEATVGALTTGGISADHGRRIGFDDGEYGHLTGFLNITKLDELPLGANAFRLEMHVASTGTIPRENATRTVYLRKRGASHWTVFHIASGLLGEYISNVNYHNRRLEEGAVYDVVVISNSQGSDGEQVENVHADDRYDFFPDGRDWRQMAELDDFNSAQVLIEHVVGRPEVPDAPSGTEDSDRRILLGGSGLYALANELPVEMLPGGVTHVESGATYNSNVITVSTTGTVRGGDGILFAVPSPFGDSATQEISLAIDGQASSEHPLHDRNGDVLHEADLTADAVYIAISDAASWDILVLPTGSAAAVADNRLIPDGGTDGQVLTKASGTDYDTAWEDAAAGGSGGVSIGDSIGTHRMVNSYTTNRMYETTVPTPASDDGDLLVITYAPDSDSPDNAIGGAEVAFVSIANILAIPTVYSGSSSADSEGSDRDALRTGFGQNDWLYIGVTVVAGGNLQIGSTDAKYAGVFTFRVLSYGTAESGQESPGNEGVAAQTPDLVTVVLYQWFDDAVDAIPSDPTAHWRFDDEWDGTTPHQGGGWFTSRIDAGDAADNNPDFDEAGWTLWVATEQTRRKVNSDDEYYYTDSGYSLYSVFDDHYSVNSGGPWHPTFADGDKWMRLRTAVGGFTRPIPLSSVTEVVWQPLVSEAAIYQRGPEVDEAETYDISPAIDISGYDQLRFTMRTVKIANNVEQAAMQVYDFIVHRPPDGWNVFSPGALSLQEGTYQFHYDNTIPNGLVIFRLVLSQITTATGDGRSADIDIPDAVRNVGGEGFNKTAGRFKFLGTSEEDVTGIYLFDNPRNNSAWQQIQWWIYGLGVA